MDVIITVWPWGYPTQIEFYYVITEYYVLQRQKWKSNSHNEKNLLSVSEIPILNNVFSMIKYSIDGIKIQ